MAENLSEYERQRLEHIKRNHEMLVRLGLVDDAPKHTPAPKEKRPRTKLPPAPPETLRRSARVKQEKPEYTGELVDTFGEDLDRKCEPGAQKRKRARGSAADGSDDDASEAQMREEVNETTMAFLRDARELMARYLTSEDGGAPKSKDGWRDEAMRRWGALAGGGIKANHRDWELYVKSRLTVCPPPSPAPLLQEFYCHDMWQLLCVCVLMSRVSSWDTKHKCISAFFEAHPTPTAFMEDVIMGGQTAQLRERIHSLGLFDDRFASLIAITTAFLGIDTPADESGFAVDLGENKIRGIGKFGWHSWLIFCCDQGSTLKAEDAALKQFCNWRASQSKEHM